MPDAFCRDQGAQSPHVTHAPIHWRWREFGHVRHPDIRTLRRGDLYIELQTQISSEPERNSLNVYPDPASVNRSPAGPLGLSMRPGSSLAQFRIT